MAPRKNCDRTAIKIPGELRYPRRRISFVNVRIICLLYLLWTEGNNLKPSPIIIFITQLAGSVLSRPAIVVFCACASSTRINSVLKYCAPIPFDTWQRRFDASPNTNIRKHARGDYHNYRRPPIRGLYCVNPDSWMALPQNWKCSKDCMSEQFESSTAVLPSNKFTLGCSEQSWASFIFCSEIFYIKVYG